MPKFDVTIWYTVAYTHNVEIEAETEAEAEAKANEIFNSANATADWGFDSGDLDIDIWKLDDQDELYEEHARNHDMKLRELSKVHGGSDNG